MENIINEFIENKKNINKYFGCSEDFFIKPLVNYRWTIKDIDGIFFLTYLENNITKECILVKKNNLPLIYEKNGYTMVIGIECIKIAFIFKNSNKI